jgi:hypothetical protein
MTESIFHARRLEKENVSISSNWRARKLAEDQQTVLLHKFPRKALPLQTGV